MGWLATSAGISGEMVRDLMIACVERRSGSARRKHPVEWFGPTTARQYIAKGALDHHNALGLKLCFTPVRSPQSNGIAEAFVKTFKRDYARLSILPDAKTVIALLPAWFEDDNEVPALRFNSLPENFCASNVAATGYLSDGNGVHTAAAWLQF